MTGQSSAGPAWGGHLALDAIVAYVDEELSPRAHRRALDHLARCPECAGEVVAQTQARIALRASTAPGLPASLLTSLRAIPTDTELPPPPAGLAIGPDGQLVTMLRREPDRRPDRRGRPGTGAVVTGVALGGLMVVGVAGVGLVPGAMTSAPAITTSSVTPAPGGTAPAAALVPSRAVPVPDADVRAITADDPSASPVATPGRRPGAHPADPAARSGRPRSERAHPGRDHQDHDHPSHPLVH